MFEFARDRLKISAIRRKTLRAYALQAKNRELEIDAAEIRIRAERRLGELQAEQPKNRRTRYNSPFQDGSANK
jgi:hypothetical protein